MADSPSEDGSCSRPHLVTAPLGDRNLLCHPSASNSVHHAILELPTELVGVYNDSVETHSVAGAAAQ